jgi:ssDNA-binding Zn-finger/Zn-ribbon topoisomerase 1
MPHPRQRRPFPIITSPECGKKMILRNSRYGKFYGCSGWPSCTVKHGAHPNGKPLGVPANDETRKLRIEVHQICGQIWGEWDNPNCDKKAMYEWLKENAPKGHIGHMLKSDLLKTKAKLLAHYEYFQKNWSQPGGAD